MLAVGRALHPKLSVSERGVDAASVLLLPYMLLGRWAKTDGSAAVAYLAENVKGDAQLPLLAGVLPSWAERAPESAWAWFQTSAREQLNFDARGMHNSALKEMFAAMGRSDFDRSLAAPSNCKALTCATPISV
jgi:hypothetical protein